MTSCFVFAFDFVAVLAFFTGAGPVSSWKSSIAITTTKLVLMHVNKASFIWRIQKAAPGKRVTIPAKPTFVSIYRRKKFQDPFRWTKSWQQCLSMLWLSCLDRAFIWRKVGVAMRATLPSNKGDLFNLKLKRIPEYQHMLWGHRGTFVKTAFYSSLHVIGVFSVFEGTMSNSRGLSVWVKICWCKALYNQLPLLWTPLGLRLSVPNSKSL